MKRKKLLIFFIIVAVIINFKVLYNYRENNIELKNKIAHDIYLDVFSFEADIRHTNEIIADLLYGGSRNYKYKLFLDSSYRSDKYRNLENLGRKYTSLKNIENMRDYIDNTTYCINNIMKEDEITDEYRKYLGKVFNTNKDLLQLYNDTINKYSTYNGNITSKKDLLIAFYEGEFFKDFLNKTEDIIGYSDFIIYTKGYWETKKQTEETSKQNPSLVEYFFKKDLKETAKKLTSKFIGKENILLKENINSNTNSYKNYTIVEDENSSIDISNEYGGSYIYTNNNEDLGQEISESELQSIAQNIINNLNKEYLYLLSKNMRQTIMKNGYEKQVYTFDFVPKINDLYDDSTKFSLSLNLDGTINRLIMVNLNGLYSTDYHIPNLSKEDIVDKLDESYRDKISRILYIKTSTAYIYDIKINEFNSNFYIGFDADSGEKLYVSVNSKVLN